MGINRGRVVNMAKLYAAMFIMLAALIVDISHVINTETDKRTQARYNLEQAVFCLEVLDYSADKLTKEDMTTCVKNLRTSPTGDVYILDRDTLEFVYEGSKDVPPGLFLSEDSVGIYYTEWNTALPLVEYVKAGIDSSNITRASYNFDGSVEWLEFKAYTTANGQKLTVVQGTQKDEVLGSFLWIRLLVALFTFTYIFWLISTAVKGKTNDITRATDTARKQ